MRERLEEVLKKLDIHLDPDAMVSTLSVAEQQFVEITKSLVRNVRVLIMDEPSATLSNKDVDKLFEVISHLREEGVTVIYISHRMEEIFRISDDVTVMRDGRHIFTGAITDVNAHDLISMMVGREISDTYPERHSPIGDPVLEVEHLYGNGDRDISFVLHKGEILGLAGLVGAGRTELAKLLYGAVPKEKGIIRVKGKELEFRNPEDAVACGIGLIPEDRKGEGAFLDYSILWNSVIMALKKDAHGIFVDDRKMEKKAEELSKTFQIKAPSLEQLVRNLSGGNQQKTVLAKTFAADTDILIFDEPTRGIDIGVKHEIYKLMNEIAERGVSIIMISSEMEELIGMSDRILVLHEGEMMGEVLKEHFDSRYILKLASGIKED
jgi:ABC-type sugar transport system ATPase subunit